MKLNDAIIENIVINESECENVSEFLNKLSKLDDVIADIYLNFKKVASAKVTFVEDNLWLIANISGMFRVRNSTLINYVTIKLHQRNCDTVIISTSSHVSEFIESLDHSFTLKFKVSSITPCNITNVCHPASCIECLNTRRLNGINLDSSCDINKDVDVCLEC